MIVRLVLAAALAASLPSLVIAGGGGCARRADPAPRAVESKPAPAPEPTPARVFHHVDTGVPPTKVPNAGLRIDLYVPELAPGAQPPPLLVWAVGGTWTMPDRGYVVAASVGDSMQRQGVA